MPTTSLRRLRRYQDMLLLGGGVVITLVALLTIPAACLYAVRQFVADERQQFTDDRSRVATAVREAETSLRRTVAFIELSWPTLPAAEQQYYDEFRRNGNRLTISPSATSNGVLFAADALALEDPLLVRRYLALARQFAISNASASASNNIDVDGYIYSMHHELIVVPDSVVPVSRLLDVGKLIEQLKIDFAKLPPREHERPKRFHVPVYWLPPFNDPLTGHRRLRLVAQATNHGEPFAVIAIEYDPRVLLRALDERGPDNAYEIAGPDGTVITSLGDDADKDRVAQAGAKHQLPRPGFFGGDVAYANGFFVMKEPIYDTGWTLLYTFSWRDVARGIANQLITAGIAVAVILAAVWTLLLMFRSRVFAPILADSARVFESEHLSRTVIHTVPVGLMLVSRETGEWLLGNPLMHEMAQQMVGGEKALADTLVAHYADFEREDAGDATVGVLRQDILFPAVDGGHFEFASSASQARFLGIDVLVAAFIDVTQRRRMQRELAEAMRAADSANQAKSAFLAAMSHEIRTPLNAILGNLELLANSPMTSVQQDRLETVRVASDGLLAVISDILDFSKIEAGEMPLEEMEFNVVEVVERVLEIFEPIARMRGIGIYPRLDIATTQTMWGDPTRMRQILNNLLSNAIKFTERGMVTLTVGVGQEAEGRPQITFAVADTGIGIAEEHRQRLFKAFSQVDLSINRRFGGTGLGLTLCQRLVNAMHGRIDVSSTPNVGSCFTVYLPLGDGIAVRSDTRMLDGERVLFLASAQEWCDFAVPHLERWGAQVQVFRHPAAIADGALEDDSLLVIWGTREQWQPEDENRVIEDALWVIDGYLEGPAHAMRTGKILSVSCLSLSGLEASVRATLLGEPLPVASASAAGMQARAGSMPLERRLHVLVAEDNAANRLLLCEQLETLGCEVKSASGGKQALELLDDDEWDVLLTDLNMPGMSGYQLAEAVRERRPALPIMAITAHATREERLRCEAAGMNRVMTKPLSLEQLNQALATIANGKGVKLAGFSVADERKFSGNAMPKPLRDIFLKSTSEALTAIEAAHASNDVDALLAELHSLRGALSVFGHAELGTACARVEQDIKRDRAVSSPEELEALGQSLRNLIDEEGRVEE
ncbi:hybrid sensor histidine kinase/response regulator [Paraburkholderia antibiotica]|uniref:Virulence sensor protein BvgS n=1 Tax=Paraburkholderia antibiotica TaxID=2728839 RepID=A0A7Y0FFH5_9BURK|nr:hybrid sensor histidine kinase/response regulator [Paraburkholderia antibiotica]NML34217.1 response regulator [Paraburkholderia antibiotica]